MNRLFSFLFLLALISLPQIVHCGKTPTVQERLIKLEEKQYKLDSIVSAANNIEGSLNTHLKSLEQIQSSIEKEFSDLNDNLVRQGKDKSDRNISIISVAIAFFLLLVTLVQNWRSNKTIRSQIEEQKLQNKHQEELSTKQFNLQEESSKKQIQLEKAKIQPLVHAHKNGTSKITSVKLTNYGGGSAVITKIVFEKDGVEYNTISDIIDLGKIHNGIGWDSKWKFTQEYYYLSPNQERTLYKISTKNLINQYKLKEVQAEQVVQYVKDAREGIILKVHYTDILDFYKNYKKKKYCELALGKGEPDTEPDIETDSET